MRLRHKKPLNPYKGQTNNDKNEFNDDDFKQQGSPHKKAANGSTDQIYKYARILTKFIRTINQEFNEYELQHHPGREPHPRLNLNQLPFTTPENTTFNAPLRGQEIKQQKQFPKLQSKKQSREDNKDLRPLPKKKETGQSLPPSRQVKNKPLESSSSINIDTFKSSIFPKTPSQAVAKTDKEFKPLKSDLANQNASNLPPHPHPNPSFMSNPKNPDNLLANMGVNASLQNYLSMPGLLNPQMLNLQMFQGLSQLQLGQIPMRYSPLDLIQGLQTLPGPIAMNMAMMGMGLNNPQMHLQQQQQARLIPNLFMEQAKVYNSKSDSSGEKNIKQAYPLKRSAFHVAIAYKIYLDKLKKAGVSFEKLEDIDPTRNAKRIKSSQSQGSKPKDSQKKRK